MNGMQGVSFGSLTAKSIQKLSFEELDLNLDGVISEEELTKVLGKEEFDVLDLSTIDKDADKKVTKEEYDLWTQEAEMQDAMNEITSRVTRDCIGLDNNEVLKVVEKLEEFENAYIEQYTETHKDISKMASEFKKALSPKYMEIKQYAMKNSKAKVKERVVENVIQKIIEETRQGGRTFQGIIKDGSTLSDNAKRLLGNELGKEADKFIKKYEGEDLEKDLTTDLLNFLAKTDKSKLADAINIWEKGKEELAKLPAEIAFKQLKDKAKSFLILAIEQGVTVKLGDFSIRGENYIMPALAQYKDIESLKFAFDRAIKQISNNTKLEDIKNSDTQKEQENISLVDTEILNIHAGKKDNIFM